MSLRTRRKEKRKRTKFFAGLNYEQQRDFIRKMADHRRLKPTIALSGATGEIKALCGLCLHPIGFYNGTWAGCMVPTDEVIAHLMLMRGDESDFWRQANQHPAWRAESGL
jgi:hypothetical protein